MTAKEYHEKIIANNPQAEAWGLDTAFETGYIEGYADGLAIEKVPSDKMLTKILYFLDEEGYLFLNDSYSGMIEYLKNKLYKL